MLAVHYNRGPRAPMAGVTGLGTIPELAGFFLPGNLHKDFVTVGPEPIESWMPQRGPQVVTKSP